MKLKTLKDICRFDMKIEKQKGEVSGYKQKVKLDPHELRQEAIKWIKEINRQHKEQLNSNDEVNHEKGENWRCEVSLANGYRNGKIAWITHFFNLTREDLK